LISSGDDGVGNFIIRSDPDLACSQAWPAWPASSPYITAVGGTQLTDKFLPACGTPYTNPTSFPTSYPEAEELLFQCTGTGETVCMSTFGGVITSGGGFSGVSNRETTAPWQIGVVDTYLKYPSLYPPLSYFNSSGRGYPDISTYASNYFIVLDGRVTRESGTSASAPAFAAMVTLWNDMRFEKGLPPMGFMNPFLYETYATNPEAFQDITTGNNACGTGSSIETITCCENGFYAAPGWDAVTGLGSPNFKALSEFVMAFNTSAPILVPTHAPTNAPTAEPSPAALSNPACTDDDSNTCYDSKAQSVATAGVTVASISLVGTLALGGFIFLKLLPSISGATSSTGEPLLKF
jgi:tripeptidyl-peptidase I